MNKLQDLLGEKPARIALLLYLLVGLVQLWAIPSGLAAWFGIHWILAVIGAAVLAWVPVLGQGAALASAVSVLGWPVVAAAALFLWPVWFLAGVLGLRLWRRRHGGPGPDAVKAAADAELFRRRISRLMRGKALPGPSAPAEDQGPPTERQPPAEAV